MNILYILLALALWGVAHSFTASYTFKSQAERALGRGWMRLYRLLYNGFALLSFLPVMALVAALPDHALYAVPSPWRYAMFAGQALSILLLAVAFLQTDGLYFLGFRQLFQPESAGGGLIIRGLYRVVRHPLYTFSLTFLWLNPFMTANTLAFYLGATAYLVIGAMFEERKLLREFGVAYAEYQKRTPMLIPFWLA